MKQVNNFESFQALTEQELVDINGGESAWYWLTYYVGRQIHNAIEVGKSIPSPTGTDASGAPAY